MWILIIIAIILVVCLSASDFSNKEKSHTETQQAFIEKHNIKVDVLYSYKNWVDNSVIKYIVDINKREIYLDNNMNAFMTIPFDDIVGCEVIIDDQIAGGIGRSIVGGILAGSTGAIVGAITAKKHIMSYKLKLYFKDISSPQLDINLIKTKVSLNDDNYIKAKQFSENIIASIRSIIYSNEHKELTQKETLFKVIVPDIDNFDKKLEVLKKIRESKNYSLADAKEYLEQFLALNREELSEDRADSLVRLFNNIGFEAYKTK